MRQQDQLPDIGPLIATAIGFLDTDGAFGAADPRTDVAKASLRHAVAQFLATSAVSDERQLRVIQGGLGRV